MNNTTPMHFKKQLEQLLGHALRKKKYFMLRAISAVINQGQEGGGERGRQGGGGERGLFSSGVSSPHSLLQPVSSARRISLDPTVFRSLGIGWRRDAPQKSSLSLELMGPVAKLVYYLTNER